MILQLVFSQVIGSRWSSATLAGLFNLKGNKFSQHSRGPSSVFKRSPFSRPIRRRLIRVSKLLTYTGLEPRTVT